MEALTAHLKDLVREIVREELRAVEDQRSSVPDEYMTARQAARLANVTTTTIRRWIREGRLQRFGAGREVRIERNAIAALMQTGNSGRPRPTPPTKSKHLVPDDVAADVVRTLGHRR